MSAETNATHTRFARVPKRGTRKCRSATNANKNPTNASHPGNTPVSNATSEVALTITEVPTCPKWYSASMLRKSVTGLRSLWASL